MRSIEEIYQAMLETISERSGFSPAEDCDLAVCLYAAAAQVQALELQAILFLPGETGCGLKLF